MQLVHTASSPLAIDIEASYMQTFETPLAQTNSHKATIAAILGRGLPLPSPSACLMGIHNALYSFKYPLDLEDTSK